jgi:hypothetical protein
MEATGFADAVFSRVRDLDARAWRTATWSAPFVVQAVVGVLLIVMWLLAKWPFATHDPYRGERAWMLTATVITTLASLAISGVLMRSGSSRRRGLSLGVAGAAAVVLIGGIVFAYLILR